jgi:hypothetical protein
MRRVGSLVNKEPLMKKLRSRLLLLVSVGWATIGFWSVPVSAQLPRTVATGHFKLPSEVHWQTRVLPAGEYTFRLQTTPSWTMVGLQGPNGQTELIALAIDSEHSLESSKLLIENRDGAEYIHDFYVAEAGLHMRYAVPKAPKGERLLAKRESKAGRITVEVITDTR